jgi:ADP-ribose pyrophosphatase
MRRELQEEMGLTSDRMEKIGTYILSAGGADETCLVYAGRITTPQTEAGSFGLADEQEDIRIRIYPAAEAIRKAFAGQVTNSVAALALYWFAAHHDRLRRAWRTA